DDRVDAQVAFARSAWTNGPRFVGQPHMQRRAIALRIHRCRRDAHVAASTNDTHTNLAAIGDEDLVHQAEPLIILSITGRSRPTRGWRERQSAWERNRRNKRDSR